MAFYEVRFPTDISYGATGGPEYSTDVIELSSGFEKRNINWSIPRARYNVAHGVRTQAQLNTLIAFFRSQQGKAHGFRYKDWGDYTATIQNIGTGDGTTAAFQLRKAYTNSGATVYRTLKKIVASSQIIYVDSVEKTVTTHYTIDNDTGIITFTGGNIPALDEVIEATFEFDVPVRFDTDQMEINIENYGGGWGNIPLVEIRV